MNLLKATAYMIPVILITVLVVAVGYFLSKSWVVALGCPVVANWISDFQRALEEARE